MTKTPINKNTDYKGRLMGMAALNGGWTPEMKEEYDYLSACWGELLAPAGIFNGKPNPAREQELSDLMEAGVFASLYRMDTHGTSEERIFNQMREQIEVPKIREFERQLRLRMLYHDAMCMPMFAYFPVKEAKLEVHVND